MKEYIVVCSERSSEMLKREYPELESFVLKWMINDTNNPNSLGYVYKGSTDNEREKCSIEEFIGNLFLYGEILPRKVAIESTTLCQLNCKSCMMRLGDYGALGKGYLKFSDYKKFIDDNPQIKNVELSNRGEMFLNPQLKEIIEYSYKKGVDLYAVNGVNLNTASDEILECLVVNEFKEISVSIDGASQETYVQYRQNGNFNKVIDNIKKINYYKKKHDSQFPKMIWQFIVMNHNERDVARAKELANELDMRIWFKPTWDPYEPDDWEMLLKETGVDFRRNNDSDDMNDYLLYGNRWCKQLFTEPRINWDGRMVGCCAPTYKIFDINVFEMGLKAALTSESYIAAKKMVLGITKGKIQDLPQDNPCVECHYFKSSIKYNTFLNKKDIFCQFGIDEYVSYFILKNLQAIKMRNKPIAIYGAGAVGKNLYHRLKDEGICTDVFVVSANKSEQEYDGIPILEISEVDNLIEYQVIVATIHRSFEEDICCNLKQLAVSDYYRVLS